MDERFTFQAQLVQEDGAEAALCPVPGEISAALGAHGRTSVRGTIQGQPFRGWLTPDHGVYSLEVPPAQRQRLGVKVGDTLRIDLEIDEEPRSITLPTLLAQALAAHPLAADAWERMSLSRRREFVQAIEGAKKPDTRARRIEKIIASLLEIAGEVKEV